MAKLVLPRIQAMVLCDGLKEADEEPDLFQLTGVRAGLSMHSFPALHPRLCVFLQMSGHRGEAVCHVEINQIGIDQVIYRTALKRISFTEPMSVVPIYFRLRNCIFPAPGLYYVQVFNGPKLIGERSLHVRQED